MHGDVRDHYIPKYFIDHSIRKYMQNYCKSPIICRSKVIVQRNFNY